MDPKHDYLDINRTLWNAKADYHLASDFYALEAFKAGKSSLNDIELDLLGDIKGKSLLHLQCHFGQDTLSLARMGAQVTGVDLSDRAIDAANFLASELGLDARFICCDLYSLPEHLEEKFDVVFTSYGTIGWLPDINRWAEIVSRYLKPGGKFVFAEFHPLVWMYDNDFTRIAYPYFHGDPIVEITEGTYADTSAPISNDSISWNHGLAEVVTSLLNNGLTLRQFREYDYSPYPCFPHVKAISEGKYLIEPLGAGVPLVYALEMEKKI